jgi:2,4-dienoyl-CoA reductase-like NADH-dependent reductase (Old Yellow Enzyme family)
MRPFARYEDASPSSFRESMSRLFDPLALGALTLPNRIVIPPMCQYSAEEGSATDWHLIHLGQLAISGAGLLIVEATAVSQEGRITSGDLGLYNDANEAALARVVGAARKLSDIPLAIQLAHAGRKASSRRPWEGGLQIPMAAQGWTAYAPSALAHLPGEEAPVALDRAGLEKVRDDFVATARRADRLGFDGIELHGAHGYLLHEFLSPISNRREDEYGGSFESRTRFPLEVFDAVRAAVNPQTPVWFRLSGTDWVEGGWDIEQACLFARELERRGAAATHVSSGGVSPQQKITLAPGYQVALARAIKQATTTPVIAVGLITEPEEAEGVIVAGDADAVAVGRAALYDPRWPWHAAAKLGAQVKAPPQYWRSQPRQFKALFSGAAVGQR